MGPKVWQHGHGPTRFGWICASELMGAINYAESRNYSFGIVATHVDRSGRSRTWPLDPAFVGMLRNGMTHWGARNLGYLALFEVAYQIT